MPLAVDQLELPPIGTNTYVVRAERGGARGDRRRPERRRRHDPLASRLDRRPLHGDSGHARPLRPHRQPRGSRRGHRRARLCARRRAHRCWNSPTPSRPWVTVRAVHAGRAARRRRDDRGRRYRVRGDAGARALSRRTSPITRTASCSPATCSSPARSAAPICPAATGTPWSSRSRGCSTPIRPKPSSARATARRRHSARARRQPVPRRAAGSEAGGVSGKIERPRGTHDVVPAEMPLGSASRARSSACARCTATARC